MSRRIAIRFGIVVVALLLAGLIFPTVKRQLAGGSAGCTLASGRVVEVQSDSIYLSMSSARDTATIETARMTIVVAPTSMQIDGRTVATLSESVADVQVHVEQGGVRLILDGQPQAVNFP